MEEAIELSIDSPGGLIDCRIEPEVNENGLLIYSVTILYPNMVDGFSRSEIFVHTMVHHPASRTYIFVEDEKGMLPKISVLEKQIAEAIMNSHA